MPVQAFVFVAEAGRIMSENSRYFLDSKFHYYLMLAVITTTLMSWLNLNSYLIILLLICRLVDGSPRMAIRTACTNLFFWAYTCIFLIELSGLLYTHDLFAAWKHMESKATLVAIPFIFLAGPFTNPNGYRQLLRAYCLMLAAICLYCLSMAAVEYHWRHDANVFFYHELTSAAGVNAVFFSGYVLVAILFLLFSGNPDSPDRFTPRNPDSPTAPFIPGVPARRMRIGLILFFTLMMLLLSSRLMLLLLAVVFIVYLIGRRLPKMKLAVVYSLAFLVVFGLGALAFTDNPFSRRYQELNPGRLSTRIEPQQETVPLTNSVSLRFFMWRAAFEILREQHAWAFGVTGGDSQNRLNQKYLDAGLSEGYLGYNFHNEYIEVLVHSGLVGWTLFMLAIAALVAMTRIVRTWPAVFTTVMILLLCFTESVLEMQHGLFLSCFFPLLHYCGRNLTTAG